MKGGRNIEECSVDGMTVGKMHGIRKEAKLGKKKVD